MSDVLRIHEELIEVYDRVYAHARSSVTADPELQSLTGLFIRRRQLEDEKTGCMDIRERAWHNGELDEVREQIASYTGLTGQTGGPVIITEETP